MLHSFPPTHFRLRLLSASLPFTFDPFLPPIYLERATLQIADNPISVGSPLSRDIGFRFRAVIPPLIPPHVYRRDHVCEISMLRDINQKNGISVAAR